MLVREQFFMLLLDREAALAVIPKLLPDDVNQRRAAFTTMSEVLSASEDITGERASRCSVSHSCSVSTPKRREGVERCPFRPQGEGIVTLSGRNRLMSADTSQAQSPSKYDRLIAAARAVPAASTIVVHPAMKAHCVARSRRGGRHHPPDPGRP